MKRILPLLAITLFFGLLVKAQDTDKLPFITVTGTAEVMVVPDEVTFSLDVTKIDKDLQVAKRLNDESVGKILELTRRFSIAPQNVKTDYISVDMKYELIRDAKVKIYNEDNDEIGKRIFKGYEVSKTVIVKLSDISKFEEFFSEVLKTGLSEVNSVTFGTSKLRENRDKARDMAMKAAREKAVAMSGSINQTIGKALKITEGNLGSQGYNNYSANANSTSGALSISQSVATFSPGAIKIEAQVTVNFLLN